VDHSRQGRLLEQAVIPSPEEQLVFLSKLQRVFAEGDFSATYKYALLIALADLAVKRGRDDGDELPLSINEIAAEYIELYWQQTAPYTSSGRQPGVLVQNNGAQAAVIRAIVDFRNQHPARTVQSARSVADYQALVQEVAETVATQPIAFLQNFGGVTDPFLYERVRGGIRLKSGAAYCLRRFQPLVQQLARSHWVGHIKRNRNNWPILGQDDDLESFLFEAPRQALEIIGSELGRLFGQNCFYCGGQLAAADVDHFVPFALYPRDLIHNFVLAHPKCNRSKSDTLAACEHLEKWWERITRNDDSLREIGEVAGRVADLESSQAIARWAYGNALSSGSQAWLRPGAYEHIDQGYLECLR
jgi:5-methylcytosine-specific restriction endonuclease McrA